MRKRDYVVTKDFVTPDGEKHTVLIYGEMTERKFHNAVKVNMVGARATDGKIFYEDGRYDLYFPEFVRHYGSVREFVMGWSICSQGDEFSMEYGIKLAKKRMDYNGAIVTPCCRNLGKDQCMALMNNEAEYIINNFEKYKFSH